MMQRGWNLNQVRHLAVEASTKHGEGRRGQRTPEYDAWKRMLQCCNNSNNVNYPRYGGRGIEVCERWYSYESFLEDTGRRPRGTTLGRIDNDGHYEPKNVQW